MRKKKFSILLFVVSLICGSVVGQAQSDLQARLDRVISSKEFDNANLSVSVIDIESGHSIAGFREEKVLVPASSLKALTTFCALEILGEDFSYLTKLSYNGEIEFDGTLKGNIYIEGSGDPTLGCTKFDQVLTFNKLLSSIVASIKEEGITCIDGDIIADESIITTQPVAPSWQWNDLGNYYASGAWGINVNENLYYIKFGSRSTVGRRPKLKSYYPEIPGLKFSNELVVDSSGTGDQAYIFGGPYNYYKRILGTIPAGDGDFTIKGAIPDPPYFLAYHIQKALKKNKIKSGEIKTIYQPDPKAPARKTINKFKSPSLKEIAKRANFESNNLFVEAMNKSIGLKKVGLASGQNGIRGIRQILKKLKVDFSGMHLEDGSGLSARNTISAFTLAKFLCEFSKEFGIEKSTYYLPRGGYSGTIKSMFSGSQARGNIWAKSGSMSRIQSYTGFVKAKSGKWRSFSMIVNGYDVDGSVIRKKMEKMMKEIYSHS